MAMSEGLRISTARNTASERRHFVPKGGRVTRAALGRDDTPITGRPPIH